MQQLSNILLNWSIILAFCFIVPMEGYSQSDSTTTKKGDIYGDLFLNVNYNVSKEQVSFRLNRLHFGYRYNLSDHLYFNGMIEAAMEDYNPSVNPTGGEYNNIVNLFEFCLGFNYDHFSGKFGLIGTELNQQQEKLWKHRHIDKVFADKYGYAPTNDFGILVFYQPSESLQFDASIVNGEGHKSLQADSSFRYALGGTVSAFGGGIIRVYTDFVPTAGSVQTNLIGIAGYSNSVVSIGLEWNNQFNSQGVSGYHRNGVSGYVSYNISKKYEVFARYDHLDIGEKKDQPLVNLPEDSQLAIAGLQYSVLDNLNLALNYRWATTINDESHSYIYFNTEIKF